VIEQTTKEEVVLLKERWTIMTQQGQSNESETKTQGNKQGQKAQGQGAKANGQASGQKKAKAEKAPKEPKAPREKKEKPQRETPAHMPKVDKVANQLPKLSDDAMTLFTEANVPAAMRPSRLLDSSPASKSNAICPAETKFSSRRALPQTGVKA
jgi:hypothetical protein